jgi:type VI protein secretion system component VasK
MPSFGYNHINYLKVRNLMWRLIFLGLIAYLVVTAFKRSQYSSKNDDKESKKNAPSKEQEIEDMVQCTLCKVHLPRSEAFLVNSDFYCSKAHIPK